ncbi:MAG: asparagine synthase (glutamine-hydrolyzing) [Mariprofundaceae bacterium]|nr:asparagine synthase (glutamine-hydrolyzing) [Mariprofundaceae bacterium]
MCGFVALWGQHPSLSECQRMASAVAKRGPDDKGHYQDSSFTAVHHRLAIVGADARGHQPMQIDGVVVVFNGCIYNYPDLRQQLENDGVQLMSDCDTEILPHLYRRYGATMFSMLQGMFAMVLWDVRQQIVLIGRDALGEKPLFVCEQAGRVGFASTLSAFEQGDFTLTPDIHAVQDVLIRMRVEAPRTMYQEVSQLPAGCYAMLRQGESLQIRRYFFLPEPEPLHLSGDDLKNHVKQHLEQAFSLRMLADKPVGIFLSGGVDSSLMAAMLARQSARPLHSFCVRFTGASDDYDESRFAQQVADHLGCEHQTLEVHDDALQCLDDLASAFDQPVSNAAALPTYLISQAAKPYVDVALSGVGGDELFGGYPRYLGMAWHQRLQRLPARSLLLSLLNRWGDSDSSRNIRGRLRRFLQGLNMDAMQAYEAWTRTVESDWNQVFQVPDDGVAPRRWQNSSDVYGGLSGLLSRYGVVNGAMAYDIQSYISDDLLVVGDRMSMAHGLELRAPFLDTNLVNLMVNVPVKWKVKGLPWQEQLKVLLKDIACDDLPRDVVYRPKQGFMAPIKHWLRSDLADEVKALAASQALGGLVRPEFVQEQWGLHQRGHDRSDILWGLLLMNRWMQQRGWEF